ncbi:MAG: inositol monophosphatase family protein [Chloroflexota bacterium]
MRPTLSDVELLARQAGELLRAGFGQRHQVDHKGVIDLVTEMDHRSEDFLLGEIRRRFPQDGIVTEESGELGGQACCLWYVDPLDGTVNYAHGVPIFTVSLAYAEDGVVRLGAVYDPMQDELFSASLGQGSWLKGRLLQASSERTLDQSLLVTGFPYDVRTNPQNNLGLYARFALCSQGVRRLGSAALDLCYVAAGRFEGYWETQLNPWDIAAGALIAQEAGARVTRMQGEPDYLRAPCTVLAANPEVHPQMLAVMHSELQHS